MTYGPLAGIRVLDMTKVLAGPLCTQYLSDLGAEVIKVEPTSGGDETRQWPPLRHGQGAVFLSVNRNKKSLAVDLKSPAGRSVVHRLAATSDVVVESFRTGVADRLGVGYATLKELREGLIYCSISGFGRTGPLRAAPGYDVILQAYSGMMAMTGEKGSGPIRMPISPIDQTAGLHAFGAIMGALINRMKTGTSTHIECSLYESAIALLGYSLQIFWEKGVVPDKCGSGHESLCPYQAFDTADQPILLGVANDSLWQKFCSVAGLNHLVDDTRFRTNPDRVRHAAETVANVQDALRRRPCADWMRILNDIGVPCAPINTLADLISDPHAAARGMFLDYQRPEWGPLKSVAYPVTINGSKPALVSPPPMLGEHTASVLRGIGYGEPEIRSLEDAGAVVQWRGEERPPNT